MAYLLDTGVLLRLVDRRDPRHESVLDAVAALRDQQELLYITIQNAAEFCNVASRPKANNGLGLRPDDALRLLHQDIESLSSVLFEPPEIFGEFKRLLATYNVAGKQVHDARLVAMMIVWQVESVLTLNDRDFRRYEAEGIHVVTPDSL